MSYRLQITDQANRFSFNGRYENLARAKRPAIEAKNSKGDEVKYVSTFQGRRLKKGSTQKQWLDDKDAIHSKDGLTFWCEGEQVEEMSQTKVLDIEGYQPLHNYTDTYVISTFYEIFADDDGMKKDCDKDRAVAKNKNGMYALWEYLNKNDVVARGEFCPASKGFVASDGYIRAIEIDGKWGLEIGVFKEEKCFQHLQEGEPDAVSVVAKPKGSRLKRI